MSQNDWNISTHYRNGTPVEGASELHSNAEKVFFIAEKCTLL